MPSYLKVGRRGTVLYPLNTLRDTHPELYTSKAKKYEGREHVMDQHILTLNCVWNDVLHFTAIDPTVLKQVLVDAGWSPIEMKFYQIDPRLLDPKKTTVWLNPKKNEANSMDPSFFEKYNPKTLDQYSTIPQTTKK